MSISLTLQCTIGLVIWTRIKVCLCTFFLPHHKELGTSLVSSFLPTTLRHEQWANTKKAFRRPTLSSNSNLAVPNSGAPGSVSPAQFYRSKNPPLLPSRSMNLGSSHAKVIRPNTPPPDYSALRSCPVREPQLVEEPAISEDPLPALLPVADNLTSWANGNVWETTTKGWGNDVWNTAPTDLWVTMLHDHSMTPASITSLHPNSSISMGGTLKRRRVGGIHPYAKDANGPVLVSCHHASPRGYATPSIPYFQ